MARPAYTLQVGDRVPFIDLISFTSVVRTVTSVQYLAGSPFMVISLSEVKDRPDLDVPIEILPQQELVYPRRQHGRKLIHTKEDELSIFNLCIGDIIPPETGWTGKVEEGMQFYDLHRGYEILTIHPFKAPTTKIQSGWRITYRGKSDATQQRMVSLIDPRFYGEHSRTFPMNVDPTTNEAPIPKTARNTSGVYQNKESGEQVTFRIRGKAGRPPLNSIPAPPLTSHVWGEWEFVGPGDRHPNDVQWKRDEEPATEDVEEQP